MDVLGAADPVWLTLHNRNDVGISLPPVRHVAIGDADRMVYSRHKQPDLSPTDAPLVIGMVEIAEVRP